MTEHLFWSTVSIDQNSGWLYLQHSKSPADGVASAFNGGGDRQGGAAEPRTAEKGPAPSLSVSLKSVSSGGRVIPVLALGASSFRSARGVPPRAVPRSMGPSPGADVQAATPRGGLQRPQQGLLPGSGGLAVELILPAFSLDAAALAEALTRGLEPAAAVLRRTAAGLGVHSR